MIGFIRPSGVGSCRVAWRMCCHACAMNLLQCLMTLAPVCIMMYHDAGARRNWHLPSVSALWRRRLLMPTRAAVPLPSLLLGPGSARRRHRGTSRLLHTLLAEQLHVYASSICRLCFPCIHDLYSVKVSSLQQQAQMRDHSARFAVRGFDELGEQTRKGIGKGGWQKMTPAAISRTVFQNLAESMKSLGCRFNIPLACVHEFVHSHYYWHFLLKWRGRRPSGSTQVPL